MTNATFAPETASHVSLRACVRQALPREHGSWSLAFEPIALGLIVAPSRAGVMLSLAAAAGFFARRPLKLLVRGDRSEERATALVTLLPLMLLGGVSLFASLSGGSPEQLGWLIAAAVPTAVFAGFDARNASRELIAEIAGTAGFALVAAAITAAAGCGVAVSGAVAVAMLGRSLPTVLCLRARIRGQKTGTIAWHTPVFAAITAVLVAYALHVKGIMPVAVVIALALLAVRSGIVLGSRGARLRAKTLGIWEVALGTAFVICAGAAFHA